MKETQQDQSAMLLELRKTKEGINKILIDNRKLVCYVIKHRYGDFLHSFDFDELVSIGMIGLWIAIQKFNPELGSFSTYAAWRIRSTVGREIFVRIRGKKRIPRISLDALDDKDRFDIGDTSKENTGLDHLFASDAVASIMSKLKARDRDALAMRYLQGANLETIGKRLNVTRERARQIIDKARNEAAKLCQDIGDSCIQ